MKACEKKAKQIWSESERDLELRIGYNAGWKDALEWSLKTMESCSGNLQEFVHNVNSGLNKIREELEQ